MSKAGASVLLSGGSVEVAVLGLVALLLIAFGAWLFVSSRQSAAQREQKRRLTVNRTGRMGDATIVDVRDYVLYYTYQVRGVAYATSQDASEFHHLLPPDTSILIGPVGLKYSPNNPANSIIVCEQWSGLRPAALQFQDSHPKENIPL
jgi:hypothetical protein